MLSVIVRWTVVEGHQRMHNSGSQLAAGTAPVVTNSCESQLRHSHSPVHLNGQHTMVMHASNAPDAIAPGNLSVVVGQFTSPVALPEPPVPCHYQDDIGRAATQHPSVTQFSSAAKRIKVANGVVAAWRCLCDGHWIHSLKHAQKPMNSPEVSVKMIPHLH